VKVLSTTLNSTPEMVKDAEA